MPERKPIKKSESPKEKPIGKPLPLIEWPKLKEKLLQKLGLEQWPNEVISAYGIAEGGDEVTNKIEREAKSVHRISLLEMSRNTKDTESLTAKLGVLRRRLNTATPETGKTLTRMINKTERLAHSLNALFFEGQEGLVLLSVTTEEVEQAIGIFQELPKDRLKCAILVSDPPHLWEEMTRKHPDIPFLEAESRKGGELISQEQREAAKEHLLDLLAPLGAYGVPDNGLIRAVRRLAEPSADIAIERDAMRAMSQMSTDSEAHERWSATQTAREERWRQHSPSQKAKIAELIESYLRPIEGAPEELSRLPEIYSETVLRLIALDTDCLPAAVLAQARNIFESKIYPMLTQVETAEREGHEAPAGLRRVLFRKADQVLLHPLVNGTLKPLLEFRARTCVEAFAKMPEIHPEFLEQAYLRVERASQAGCDVTTYETILESARTSLIPKVKEEEVGIISQEETFAGIEKDLLEAALAGDREKIAASLAARETLLHPQNEKPTVESAEALSQMSIGMGILFNSEPPALDINKELDLLNAELSKRLRGPHKPNGAKIAATKKELFKWWRQVWTKRLEGKSL